MAERRTISRVSLRSVGSIDLGDRFVPCQTLDLSEAGLGLVTPEPDLPLWPVRVRFQLGRRDATWTEVDGVLRRRAHWHQPKVGKVWGLELMTMDLGTKTRVRDYLLSTRRTVVRSSH